MKRHIRPISAALFIIYVFYLLNLLFFAPEYGRTLTYGSFFTKVNLVPFKTISNYILAWVNGNASTKNMLINILGNLAAFVPFGILCPIIFTGLRRFSGFISFMIVLLILVELIQILSLRGSFDIDDIILNLAGALIAFGIMRTRAVRAKLEI